MGIPPRWLYLLRSPEAGIDFLLGKTPHPNPSLARMTVAEKSLIISPKTYFERLRMADWFPSAQPLEVEIGAGDGSFLVNYAKAHPHTNLLGVERLLGRLRKIDRKGRRLNLENLMVLRVEAAYFLEFMLPPASVSALHIYFPDPWPKRKHRKNRLINETFPDLAKKVLLPQGKIFLRTDDLDYFAQMTEVFQNRQDFAELSTPTDLLEIRTDFERGFNAKGIPTNHRTYQLKALAA